MNSNIVQGEAIVGLLGGPELYEGVVAVGSDPGAGNALARGIQIDAHLAQSIVQEVA